jgi:hypothetical protein
MHDTDSLEGYKESFGGCTYATKSPSEIADATKVVNVKLSFEEALKLNVAVATCVQHLTRQDRSTPDKRRSGLKLIIHLDEKRRIRVQLGKLPPKERG